MKTQSAAASPHTRSDPIASIRRGLTLVEVAAATIAILCLAIVVVAAADDPPVVNGESHPRSLQDRKQLKDISQAVIILEHEFNRPFRPGLVDTLPMEVNGQVVDIPGRGEEDVSQNTTAAFYSYLISANYVKPTLLVSPVDRNPRVHVNRKYDYNRYNPGDDNFWDPNFQADLQTVSNVSYAHPIMYGARQTVRREAAKDGDPRVGAALPALSNRGPAQGKPDPDSYTCGPHGNWLGAVAWSDHRVTLEATMTPAGLVYGAEDEKKPDNIFAVDDGMEGSDVVMSFTSDVVDGKPKLQHD